MSGITPALTAEEWREYPGTLAKAAAEIAARGGDLWVQPEQWPKYRHVSAAVMLDGQPFGFTAADVDTLQEAAAGYSVTIDHDDIGPRLSELAERIAALLPPRTEAGHG